MFELLSPAGSVEALRAGVQNGADAVYLGGNFFSARASCCNFNNEQLILAVEYAHIRNVKIFVTVNTSIKEEEINDFIKYTDFLYEHFVDGIILSDIGMASILRKRYPNMELHASTQISCHSLRDVLEMQKLGFDRVVVARELSIEEIKKICENVDIDIEVFVHGALCLCYSGQCLMSSLIGNRSGNRGRCAQPCRQKYKLIDINKNEVIENINGNYLLSPKDLCSIDNIEKILQTGVKSLKIEGRMKKQEYVATVTKSYRDSIDSFENNVKIDKDSLKRDLKAIFNRKFTQGYLMNKSGLDIINNEKPHNIGLKVGEVLGFDCKKNRLKIKLIETLSKGDGINLGQGNIGRIIKDDKILKKGFKDEIIEIDFLKNVKKSTSVYKTFDKDLMEKALETTKEGVENKRIPLSCKLYIKLFEKIKFVIGDICIFSSFVVEKAKTKTDFENIIQKLSKTKNTPFDFNFEKVEIDEYAFVPVSVLNNLRRDAIELYKKSILDKFKDRKINFSTKEIFIKNYSKEDFGKITLKVHKNSQLNTILENKNTLFNYVKEIYTEDFFMLDDYFYKLEKMGIKLIYSAPGVLKNEEYNVLKKYLENFDKKIFSKVQISTWGEKSFFKENFKTEKFNIDTYFNIYNSKSINFFINNFQSNNVTISQEINEREIKKMIDALSKDIKEKICIDMIIYGNQRSMITQYCPIDILEKNYNKDKKYVKSKVKEYILRDEKNRDFRLFQDVFSRTEIRNYKTLDLRDKIKDILAIGINRVRLDFTFEDSKIVFEKIFQTINFLEKNKKINSKDNYLAHFYDGVD